MKVALGRLLALAIGVPCRLGGIPLPAPPALIGAPLVLAMTFGYVPVHALAAAGTVAVQDGFIPLPEDLPIARPRRT